MTRGTIVAVLMCLAAAAQGAAPPSAVPPSAADLDRLEVLVTRAEDVDAIKRLTFIFGYYRDKFLDESALSLFTDQAVADFAGGKYVGKASIARLMRSAAYKMPEAVEGRGPQYGLMNDHILMQQVITVAPDGLSARGRFKDWNTSAVFGRSQTRSAGVYENAYVKDQGVWKISAMAYCLRYSNPYLVNPRDIPVPDDAPPTPVFFPTDPTGPDRQSNTACHLWPHPGISPPLHYPHPIDGDYIHRP